jgi:hypothetical protein
LGDPGASGGAHFQFLLRAIRNPGALLDWQLTVRLAQNLDRRRRFDVLLSTHNEVDFGRRGIQNVNLPGGYLSRPGDPKRFSHHIPGLHRSFRAFCYALGRYSDNGPRRSPGRSDAPDSSRWDGSLTRSVGTWRWKFSTGCARGATNSH